MDYTQKELIELIYSRLLGTADEKGIRELEDWLGESPVNRELYERLQNPIYRRSAVAELYGYDAAGDWSKVIARRELRRRRSIARRLLPYAAALAVMIVAGTLLLRHPAVPDELAQVVVIEPGSSKAVLTLPGGQAMELVGDTLSYNASGFAFTDGQEMPGEAAAEVTHTLTVPRGGEFFVRLPDGTGVWLNSESVFSYPTTLGGCERLVSLDGEAYFEVTKSNVPFTVSTSVGKVEVYGTSFNVKAYSEGDNFHVTLVSGSVGFTNGGGSIMLEPGEQAYIAAGGEAVKRRVNVAEYIGWQQGLYIFRNRKLQDIMHELSRWYDVSVEFGSETLKEASYSGNLKRYDRINTFMDLLARTGDLHYRIDGKTITLYE